MQEKSPLKEKRTFNLIQKIKQSTWIRRLAYLLLIIVTGLFGYTILGMNIFYIENIEITSIDNGPLKFTDRNEMEDFLTDYIGKRLYQIDSSTVESEILESFYFTKEVSVAKKFPKTLHISIEEKKLIMNIVVVDSGGNTPHNDTPNSNSTPGNSNTTDGFLADESMSLLSRCSDFPGECEILPVCEVTPDFQNIQIGMVIHNDGVQMVHSLDKELKSSEVQVLKYYIPEEDVVVVFLNDKTRVIFNTNKNITEQINNFEYTQENLLLQNKKYKELDLRFDRPIIRVDKYTDWMTE